MGQQEMQTDWMDAVMELLEQHLGADSEIVLYDLSKQLGEHVMDVRNGHITGTKAGLPNKADGMELYEGTSKKGNRYNIISCTKDAKLLRTSVVYLRDESGKAKLALGIKTNITQSVKFEDYLRRHNGSFFSQGGRGKEIPHVRDVLEHFLKNGQELAGKPVSQMTKEDKILVLGYLDQNGAFMIAKSNERVCEFLDISQYSLYNYLELVRNQKKKEESPPVV